MHHFRPERTQFTHTLRATYALAFLLWYGPPAFSQTTGRDLTITKGADSVESAQNNPMAAAAQAAQGSSDRQKVQSTYDKIWRFAEWYDNDSNPVAQRVLFSGRYQHEYAALDADEGDLDEWNVRRVRLGPRITIFRTFTLHSEVELNPQEADPLYVRLTDLYVQWNKSSRLALTVGKDGVPFTMDGATSSKELLCDRPK